MKKCGIEIESLSAHRVLDKLAQAGVRVLSAERAQKNVVTVWINGKDEKKVFAILRGSCYNVKKVRYRGLERLKRECLKAVGLVAGAFVFLCGVLFTESRVLKIRVVGSGAYYAREVNEILCANGTGFFSAKPAEDSGLTAKILSLPRVSFCSLALEGGVLTVTVEVSDESGLHEGTPLLAPAGGTVEELVIVRGTAKVAVGDTVAAGDVLVENSAPVGESGFRPVIVIARAAVRCTVAKEYALGETEAIFQARLDFGEIENIKTTQTAEGWLVEGSVLAEASINLD